MSKQLAKCPQFDRCKQVKAECNMSAVAEVDFAPVPDVILFQSADFLDPVTKAVGMLPIGRTVVMKYPDVTRAISFEISGRRTTDRWLSALYRQRVKIDRGILFW